MPWNSHSWGQADWLSVFVRDRKREKCFFQYMRTLTWHHPIEISFFSPFSHHSLSLSFSPPESLSSPAPPLPFVSACLRVDAPNANQTSEHPLSPGPVCGSSTLLCFWSLAPDCSPPAPSGLMQILQLLCQNRRTPLWVLDSERQAARTMKMKVVKY